MPTYQVELHGRKFRIEARDQEHMVEAVNQLDRQLRDEQEEDRLTAETDTKPRTRGWFRDVGASALRGPLKAWDASAKMLEGMFPSMPTHINLPFGEGRGRPFLENRNSLTSLIVPHAPSIAEQGIAALGDPETKSGAFLEGTTQFVTGYAATKRLTGGIGFLQKLGRASTATKATLDGAVASGVFFDGQEANLANLIEMAPALSNPVTEFLATDENTPELEGRLKNAVTDALGGAAVERILGLAKAVKGGRKLKAAPAAENVEPTAAPAREGAPTPEPAPAAAPTPTLRAVTADASDQPRAVGPVTEERYPETTIDAHAEASPGYADLLPDEAVDRLSKRFGITEEKLAEVRKALDDGVPAEDVEKILDLNPNHIDWSNVRNAEDVVALMNTFTRVLGDDVAKRAGYAPKTVEWMERQAAKLADETGGGYSAAVNILDRVKDLPQVVILQRKLVTASAVRLRTLAEKVANGTSTPADIVEFLVHDKRHALLQVVTRGTRATVGRALRVMQEGVRVSEEAAKIGKARVAREQRRAAEAAAGAGKAAEDATAKPLGQAITIAEAEAAAKAQGVNLDDVYKLAREIMDGNKDIDGLNRASRSATWFAHMQERLSTLYINNLLSGIPTLMVNVSSGFYKMIETTIERYGAAGLSYFGKGDKWDRVAAHKATVAAFTSWRSALTMAGKAWREGLPQSDILARNESLKYGGTPTAGIGQVFTAPSRAIMTIDEFFKHIFVQQEMASRAVEVAAAAARLEKTAAAQEATYRRVLKETMESPPDDVMLDAVESARYNTFQNDPKNRLITWLSNGSNNVPLLKLVLPFVKTPYNIVAQGIERSPLGVFQKRVRDDLSGINGRRAQREVAARLALGTAAMGTVWNLADSGLITGSSQGGKGERNTADLERPPYSIKIGDTWYSYQRLDPIGTMIGLTVDLAQYTGARNDRLSNDLTIDDPEAGEAAGVILATFTESLADKTFFKGLSDFFGFVGKVQDGSGGIDAGKGWAGGVLVNLVPYSSMMRNIARSTDPVQRDAQTFMERLRAQTPGFSDSLPARVDVLGREVMHLERLGPDFASPFIISKEDSDPVAKALAESGVSYRMPRKEIAGVKLDEQIYSRYLQLRGAEVYRIVGESLSGGAWAELTQYQRELYMEQVFSAASRLAGAALAEEDETLRSAIEAHALELGAVRSGALQ